MRDKYKAFLEFHCKNPHVYLKITAKSRQAKKEGRKNYGMKAVFEELRWTDEMGKNSLDHVKLDNNFAPYYSRLIMEEEEDLKDFFRVRNA